MFKKIKQFLFHNTDTRQTVAKNSFWLTVSNFGGRAIKAAIIIYAARALGTADYGVFSYAVTLAGFMGLFMDPGVNAVLTRDIGKSSEKDRSAIFSTVLAIKLCLIAGGVAIIIFIGPYFSTLPGATVLLPIVAFILMFDTLREFFMSLFRGLEKMEWEAGIYLFTNLAIVIFGFLFILHNPTAASLSWGYAIGTIIGAIAAMVAIRKYLAKFFSDFSLRLIRPIIQTAWPFAIVSVLGLFFTNTDILIISWMRTASDVGIYSAAIRIIQVLYLVPGILQFSTLPLFARLAGHDDKKFRAALERTLSLLFMISIPLVVGGIVLGTQIMTFIFGNAFAPGGPSLKLLLATIIVDYPGALIANAIFTYGKQKSLIFTSAVGGTANVLFDLLLIPRFGITGSAVATLIAQTLANGYLWYVMKKLNYFTVLPHLKKIGAAAALMSLATIALLMWHVNVLVNVLISTGIYFAVLRVLREPVLIEIKAIIPFGKKSPAEPGIA